MTLTFKIQVSFKCFRLVSTELTWTFYDSENLSLSFYFLTLSSYLFFYR